MDEQRQIHSLFPDFTVRDNNYLSADTPVYGTVHLSSKVCNWKIQSFRKLLKGIIGLGLFLCAYSPKSVCAFVFAGASVFFVLIIRIGPANDIQIKDPLYFSLANVLIFGEGHEPVRREEDNLC